MTGRNLIAGSIIDFSCQLCDNYMKSSKFLVMTRRNIYNPDQNYHLSCEIDATMI